MWPGFDVVRQANKVRAAIGLAGQYAAIDEFLTGFENIEMVGRLYRVPGGLPAAGRRAARTSSIWSRLPGGQ